MKKPDNSALLAMTQLITKGSDSWMRCHICKRRIRLFRTAWHSFYCHNTLDAIYWFLDDVMPEDKIH